MATKMVMPLLGQTMEEGTIIQWFKNEGDQIKEGEPLLEVMTDKANMEVEAPENGVLRKILAQVDDIIPVKEPIAIIGTADEPIDDLLGETPAPEAAEPVAAAVVEAPVIEERVPGAPAPVVTAGTPGALIASPAARRVAREKGVDLAALAGRGTGPNGRIIEKDVMEYAARTRVTPLAGKMAEDLGVPVSEVAGTGVGGKVTSEDIRKAAEAQPAGPTYEAPAIGSVIPFTGMRKTVARNVAASAQSAVHVTLVMPVDMTECVKFRASVLDTIEKRHGVRVSFTDIIAKAAARAIEEKPIVNASLQEDKIVIHDQVNIGIATAIEGGLVVPVVRDVDRKSIPVISAEIKELVARARSGRPSPDDFAGGTFTITNLGAYGVDSFDPVITPGQSAILGVCAITEKPVVKDGEIVIRSMMNLCLSFDHRVMDGAPAAEYLAALRRILESPFLMFM
jgi:pyruvate dehydrogenase E2 component (dihydrolipoamide acetyltransferase)